MRSCKCFKSEIFLTEGKKMHERKNFRPEVVRCGSSKQTENLHTRKKFAFVTKSSNSSPKPMARGWAVGICLCNVKCVARIIFIDREKSENNHNLRQVIRIVCVPRIALMRNLRKWFLLNISKRPQSSPPLMCIRVFD